MSGNQVYNLVEKPQCFFENKSCVKIFIF